MVLDNLIKDFPTQFHGKKNIEALCSAFDKQMVELFDVFTAIKNNTSIDTAVGKQLDMIGDIVGLTRAEATLLCGDDIYFNELENNNVLEDDRYRLYLKYKAFKNSDSCTYSDIIKQLKVIAGFDNVKYEENEEYPATVILSLPLTNGDQAHPIGSIPTIAPAGVSVLYKFRFGSTINIQLVSAELIPSIAYCGSFNCGTFPK